MTELPIQRLWKLAHSELPITTTAREFLEFVREVLPVQSLSLMAFFGNDPGCIRRVLYANSSGLLDTQPRKISCSLSRWLELRQWADSATLLEQPSPRRSGKLAWLASEELTGSLVALGLHSPPLDRSEPSSVGQAVGIAVLEIEHGRLLCASSEKLLRQISAPLGFYLQKFIPSEHHDPALVTPPSGQLQEQQDPSESIVGSGNGLKKVMERVSLVSSSDMPVLILGDTGTGKEVIARAIHSRSSRSNRPFLRVNCGAIPSELIDSQLFGHERGSFTGASDQRKGWFERADGGTLFLDEVGELPLAAQVRLLRVLQEHQIERVGGEKTIQVDVRIVAATHRDLAAMVHQRTFREDLWYRINLFPILLPRLCERLEDIPSLTKHFARKAAAKLGLPYAEPTSSDVDRLLKYSWPGNIRELQAVVDRAVILGRGHHLDFATALGASFTLPTRPDRSSDEPTFYEVIPESSYLQPTSVLPSVTNQLPAQERDAQWLPLDEVIKQHIEKTLVKCKGQVEGKRGAARILQINPHTLRAKMRKLGIRWADYRSEDD
ncbi:MAG: sigma-54 interaction domain-containing protein [Planctomycetota bacterium]